MNEVFYLNPVLTEKSKLQLSLLTLFLKNYWSEDSYLYRDQIHLSLDKLSKLNLVNVSYDFNNELETIALNIEKINEAYKYLKRINPKEEEKEIADFLSSLTTKS